MDRRMLTGTTSSEMRLCIFFSPPPILPLHQIAMDNCLIIDVINVYDSAQSDVTGESVNGSMLHSFVFGSEKKANPSPVGEVEAVPGGEGSCSSRNRWGGFELKRPKSLRSTTLDINQLVRLSRWHHSM